LSSVPASPQRPKGPKELSPGTKALGSHDSNSLRPNGAQELPPQQTPRTQPNLLTQKTAAAPPAAVRDTPASPE
jgi:hypothetical protein